MADVFISYSKTHRADAEQLAHLLQEKGYSVWWDTELVSGDNFTNVILSELDKARSAIVIWSPGSVKSDWVRSEASRARAKGILIAVRTSNVSIDDIPPPFDALHTVLVTDIAAIETALIKNLSRAPGQPENGDRESVGVEPTISAGLVRPQPSSGQNHIVVLVHGIRTRALWMSEVKPVLEQAGYIVAPTSYGVFGIVQFLSPFQWQRDKAIARVIRDIWTAIRVQKLATGSEPHRVSVIAHSFGTYVISRILMDNPEFQWYRIIFCGSVVRDDYAFEQVVGRFESPLLNEVGTKDYWPAIAESAGWGYGSVGSNGLNRPTVETRWHQGYRHSDFLNRDFCSKYWVPFLDGEKPRLADNPTNLPMVIQAITMLPLRWAVPLVLCLSVLFQAPRVSGYFATIFEDHSKSATTEIGEPSNASLHGADETKLLHTCSSELSPDEYNKCNP